MATSRQQYIDNYAEYAMQQMRRYGIPASITLAQGLIESANGKSTLAQTANNHFGVKGTFNGNYVLANDDHPNEQFKKYDSVGQSYEDHSKVLMRDRYQKYVGNLAADDYRGWAAGIKKGGYASDKNYVSTLVNVIEKNNLQQYDQIVMAEMKSGKVQRQSSSTAMNQTKNKTGTQSVPNGQYAMPVKRSEFMLVTSPYGQRQDPMDSSKTQIHHGIDIKTNKESVLATENGGTVIGVDHRTNTTGGKTVTVEYSREDGTKTRVQYMHLSDISVKKGDTVNAGQKLGVSGNTGTRTTGEHLHLGVINVADDGKMQWVNPAAYLAGISEKGNLTIQAQHNGKDLLADYKAKTSTTDQQQQTDKAQTPENWLSKLMGSNDAALGLGNGENSGLLDGLMQMFMSLLMLTMQQENKTREEKMQTITDAVTSHKIDLTSMVSNFKSADITVTDKGNAVLHVNDGQRDYSHELTNAEQTRLSEVLHSNSDDATKQQKIGIMVSAMAFSQQAAYNYEQIESQQQSQTVVQHR